MKRWLILAWTPTFVASTTGSLACSTMESGRSSTEPSGERKRTSTTSAAASGRRSWNWSCSTSMTYRHYAHRDPLAFKSIMSLPQPSTPSYTVTMARAFVVSGLSFKREKWREHTSASPRVSELAEVCPTANSHWSCIQRAHRVNRRPNAGHIQYCGSCCGPGLGLYQVSWALLTQVTTLFNLAPDILEAVPFLPWVEKAKVPVSEQELRTTASEVNRRRLSELRENEGQVVISSLANQS